MGVPAFTTQSLLSHHIRRVSFNYYHTHASSPISFYIHEFSLNAEGIITVINTSLSTGTDCRLTTKENHGQLYHNVQGSHLFLVCFIANNVLTLHYEFPMAYLVFSHISINFACLLFNVYKSSKHTPREKGFINLMQQYFIKRNLLSCR